MFLDRFPRERRADHTCVCVDSYFVRATFGKTGFDDAGKAISWLSFLSIFPFTSFSLFGTYWRYSFHASLVGWASFPDWRVCPFGVPICYVIPCLEIQTRHWNHPSDPSMCDPVCYIYILSPSRDKGGEGSRKRERRGISDPAHSTEALPFPKRETFRKPRVEWRRHPLANCSRG